VAYPALYKALLQHTRNVLEPFVTGQDVR